MGRVPHLHGRSRLGLRVCVVAMKPVAYLHVEDGFFCPACASLRVGLSVETLELGAAIMALESLELEPVSKRSLIGLRGEIEEEYLEALIEIHGPCQRMYSAENGASEFYEFSDGFTINVQEVFEAAEIECAMCKQDVEDDGAGYIESRAQAVDMIMDIEDPKERAAWLLTLSQIQAKEETV